jgi:hypothetical protein
VLERKRAALDAQIKALNSEFAAEELELESSIRQQVLSEEQLDLERNAMNRIRLGDFKVKDRVTPVKAVGDSE